MEKSASIKRLDLNHSEFFTEAWPFPTLLINGENDAKFAGLGQAWMASVATRGARLPHRLVPGAGHRVPWDQPDLTAEIIAEFLSKISPT
jgi:pimeloyl-ACP methyl ester carboxylesterase